MANKRFYQFLFTKQPKLTKINALLTVGSTGAVSAISGPGVQGCTRLGTGIYKLKLQDNYYAFVGANFSVFDGITGSSVAGGSFITGTLYQILTLGTTTQAQWVTAGFDPDYTAAVGGVFVAVAGGAGTGTVKAIGVSNLVAVELAQNQQSMLQNLNTPLGRGSAVTFSTYSMPTSAGSGAQVPILADPNSGCQIHVDLWFRDSSVSAF